VQQPLTWVGYDASPYAVAKAAVLLEMMRGGAEPDSVLQVQSDCLKYQSDTCLHLQAARTSALYGGTCLTALQC
jgi:hypothetical protein